MNRLALTERRRMDCDGYLFPADYYEIPDVEEFQDIEAVRNHAFEKLKSYEKEPVDLYLNGGLSVEVLVAIQAAARLDIRLNMWHYDCEREIYFCQPLCWKPIPGGNEKETTEEEIVLCQGRHWGAEKKSVFPEIPAEKLFDFQWQEKKAREFLKVWRNQKIRIYLSGLTSAFVSVLNAASQENVSIVWLHYDYDTEDYFPQDMDKF